MTGNGARLEEYELLLTAEASTATALPANTSVTYTLEFSAVPAMTDPVTYTCSAWKQTGSAAGADAAEVREDLRYQIQGLTLSTGFDKFNTDWQKALNKAPPGETVENVKKS